MTRCRNTIAATGGTSPASIGYSQALTSIRLAAQAANKPTVSPKCRRSQQVWRIVLMGKASGDSSARVPGNIFAGIQDSFTTQGLPQKPSTRGRPGFSPAGRPDQRETLIHLVR